MTGPTPVTPSEAIHDAKMSPRARAYLWATAIPNAVIGGYCILDAPILRTPSYTTIGGVLPFPAWGALFTLVALFAAGGAISGRELPARLALVGSAFAFAMWAGGFGWAYFQGHLSGPTGVLVWGTLAVKDLIVCRQPLRSPFEVLTRAFTGRAQEG